MSDDLRDVLKPWKSFEQHLSHQRMPGHFPAFAFIRHILHSFVGGQTDDAEKLATQLANQLVEQGALDILND